MKTDDLIEALARGPEEPPGPPPARRIGLALAIGLLVGFGLMAAFLRMRPDIGSAMMPVMMKAGFSAAAVSAVMPALLRLATPGRPMGRRALAIGGFVAVCALVAIVTIMGVEPEKRLEAWMGGGFPWCLALIPALAIPCAAALFWAMRALAPTRLGAAGAALGAVSGGVGAVIYAMYCPIDSVAFVVTWYSAAIGLCAAIGAILGARFLRW